MTSHSFLVYCAYRLLGILAPLVPQTLGYWLAAQVGALAYHLNRRGSEVLRENLRHVLGDEADEALVETTAIEVFRNLAKNYYDLFRKHALGAEEATDSITVHGLHHMEDGLEDGRGLIIVSAHFGAFDASWLIGRRLNLNITAAAEHLKPDRLYRYVCQLRDREWITFLPVDRPLMGLFRALRRGETVALAGDRDITGSGILVDFFGARARLPDGPVQLALRTGANVLTIFAVRQPDNKVVINIEPPIQLDKTGDFGHDVLVNTRKVTARMEEWIGRHPDQWLVLYPIWRDNRHAA